MNDEISDKTKQTKKVYKSKMWTCEVCNIPCTMKNKTNHLRTDKHKNNVKK